ncbi:hypothetical protein AncyloWKF20_07600 [Ancylobacter sp. WKF20]|uniref:hypothetical protein n=1 Tax=Ancylobacter sp. WKF20 TaxID=3039801 RepID=UPI0024343CCF|nr:hypothetical protein [Ancylobacter sp. WKF20]WGD31674.1 hypothetical protein AncyloWKF20_07600 [Ancylobacter sp. WKF20]
MRYMKAQEAALLAKDYVQELFGQDGLSNLALEEIELQPDGYWSVTIGFHRPWEEMNSLAALSGAIQPRSLRVVRIKDATKQVESVKKRDNS